MIAQTISYGLLAARFSHAESISVQNLVNMVPPTNPFLRELLGTFLNLAGRKHVFDFDELGIQDVVDVLNSANAEAVKADFGNRTRNEDPIIHFYEHFLKTYDKKLKVQRGVFYTPQPVVSYIVRSVHELLQTEFGLEDGLASTTAWGEMAARNPELKIPDGTSPDEFFVNVLDPATGTATFLVEVIEVIFKHLKNKCEERGLPALPRIPDSTLDIRNSSFLEYWNAYVPHCLLPRLYGYELLVAPYTIAHMKLSLKLSEINTRLGQPDYEFKVDGRAHIYLTNSLEPPSDKGQQAIVGMFPALAHEAEAVNAVKRKKRFTVVVGNPPYAAISSNLTPELRRIVDPYRYINHDRIRERSMLQFEKNIQDDYIKFFAYSQARLGDVRVGICALITNHSYLDGPTLRGVRWNLTTSCDSSWFLDLHGNTNKSEEPPCGKANGNVFDIKQGVSIAVLLCRANRKLPSKVWVGEMWRSRSEKYEALSSSTVTSTSFTDIQPKAPYFYLVVSPDSEGEMEWESWPSIVDVFTKRSTGTETGFDRLLVNFTLPELRSRIAAFANPAVSKATLSQTFDFSEGHAAELFSRRNEMATTAKEEFRPFQLRAYDYRFAFLRRNLLKTNSFNVMTDLGPSSPGLVTTRQTKEAFAAFAVSSFCGHKVTSSYDRSYVFPLFTHLEDPLVPIVTPCISNSVIAHFSWYLKSASSHRSDEDTLARSIFYYCLAVLNAPSYTERFGARVKRDWPRVPFTLDLELFHALALLGGELVSLHLMESAKLDNHISSFIGGSQPEIEKVAYFDDTVLIDKARTAGFRGVLEEVWNFRIGGHQVCEKWLKDRKGRTLSEEDINHYHRIVVALSETIRLMSEIDNVIEAHGGWPDAFQTAGEKEE